jgi:predicted Zn-dependent protease
MPRGRVALYTGILPAAEDNTGVAVVTGHELAHTIATHGNERVSQGLPAQPGAIDRQLVNMWCFRFLS